MLIDVSPDFSREVEEINSEEASLKRRNILGLKIVALRTYRRMSQQQLATAIGVKRQAVARYETGDVSPTYDVLEKIAKVCSINLTYFSLNYTPEEFIEMHNNGDIADAISQLPRQFQLMVRASIQTMLNVYNQSERDRKTGRGYNM